MCGIFSIFCPHCKKDPETYLKEVKALTIESSDKIRHRGPDWSGLFQDYNEDFCVSMSHERLSIIDPDHGAQPLTNKDNSLALSVNGEIYNYLDIKEKFKDKYQFKTDSDCEVINALYNSLSLATTQSELRELCCQLDGVFAFVLYDRDGSNFLVARDPIGINSLYYGFTRNGEICFASELKSLHDFCHVVKEFPPGHYATYYKECSELVFDRYYYPSWLIRPFDSVANMGQDQINTIFQQVKTSLEQAVRKRLMSDVPFGVLLSGGLDSSLIASIAMKIVRESGTKFGNQLHSYSIGLENAPDLVAAQKVADHIGTIHHSFTFTVEDGLNALRKVIYHLETYDVTTIRASTPMFLLSRMIKSTGVKMVLSGEGADEILGGYLYFHKAPSSKEFHKECIKRLQQLHYFDCLRANKSTMAWGLEGRFPFLDRNFLEMAVPVDPELKCASRTEEGPKIEKYVLRKAFEEGDYLPPDLLWRQKEQFSDGVGYNWIDTLKSYIETEVTDEDMGLAKHIYSYNTPATKEAFYYRRIFEELFPNNQASMTVKKWIPETTWAGVDSDPSGRSQGHHAKNSEWTK